MRRLRADWIVIGFVAAMSGCMSEAPSAGNPSDPQADVPVYDAFVGETPQPMAAALVQQGAAELLSLELQRALFEYAHTHPSDARPWLLLARDSMARDWGGWAERQYASALAADARVVGVPYVLTDLLRVVSRYDGLEQDESSALIVDAFGETALPALDRALKTAEDQGDQAAADRLRSLRAELGAHE